MIQYFINICDLSRIHVKNTNKKHTLLTQHLKKFQPKTKNNKNQKHKNKSLNVLQKKMYNSIDIFGTGIY